MVWNGIQSYQYETLTDAIKVSMNFITQPRIPHYSSIDKWIDVIFDMALQNVS